MEEFHLGKFEHRPASHSLEHSAEQVDLHFVQVCGFEGNEPVGWYDKDGVLIADPCSVYSIVTALVAAVVGLMATFDFRRRGAVLLFPTPLER
jgi:hypothetical protein